MKNIVIFFIIVMLISCKEFDKDKLSEIIEYDYDFSSGEALYEQYATLGFEHCNGFGEGPNIRIGKMYMSIFGVPVLSEEEQLMLNSDSEIIILMFRDLYGREISRVMKQQIKNNLREKYGEPVEKKIIEGFFWNAPVAKYDSVVFIWELEDRYLFLNNYDDFDIRIKKKSVKER